MQFTYEIAGIEDTQLIEELYQFGRDHPLNENWACGPYPYPLKSDIEKAVSDPDLNVMATYADGVLRHYIIFKNNGETIGAAVWPFGDGITPVPEGLAMLEYLYGNIETICGQKAKTSDKVSSHFELYDSLGVERI